jgi:amino acid transporter
MAQELEIYKLLVTLAAALIAASITSYSIAISVLGSERARIEAQVDEIRQKATERIRRGEIKDYEASEKQVISVRKESAEKHGLLSRLTLWNVVVFPCGGYAFSILIAMNAILTYPQLGEPPSIEATRPGVYVPYLLYWQSSALCLIVGAFLFVVALYGIEKAAGQPRPVKVAVEHTEESGVVAYYFVDSAGTKLVVDWHRKVAYWFDERIDQAAREGKIKIVAVAGKTQQAFVKDNQLTYMTRAPTPEELPL